MSIYASGRDFGRNRICPKVCLKIVGVLVHRVSVCVCVGGGGLVAGFCEGWVAMSFSTERWGVIPENLRNYPS